LKTFLNLLQLVFIIYPQIKGDILCLREARIYLSDKKMGRIYAGKKGKSGSNRPVERDLSFVRISAKEVEEKVLQLTKENYQPSQIGLIMRDSYGVPSIKALTGKSISKILEENGNAPKVPEDLQSLVERFTKLSKHLEANPKDVHNKRGLQMIESKIRRLSKYYKKEGKIPMNWGYR